MKRLIILPLVCAAALWTQGCKDGDAERAGRELDKAAENTKEGLKEAAEKAGDAAEKAGDKIKDATR